MKSQKLQFRDLSNRHYGVTDAIGAAMAEAADVCLSRHHQSPVHIEIRDSGQTTLCEATWATPDSRSLAANANTIDATETGAYCIALAAVELTRGLVASGRAETLTGADYYLSEPGANIDDYESLRRLEVSGTDTGSESHLLTRLKTKISQAANGASNVPAIAAVVGFQAKIVASSDVELT